MSDALVTMAGLVTDSGRRWGEIAAPFQWADARAVLDQDPAAPRFHYLTRPRAASKTTDLAAASLAALVDQLPSSAQAYAVAADRDQARLLVADIAGFVARTPAALFGEHRPMVESWKVTMPSGASLVALAADGPSAFGLRPHLVVVGEHAQWADSAQARQVWEAVVSSMAKVAPSRLVVLTTAGDPGHPAHRVLEAAKASPAWRVNEVPGPCPWIADADLDEQRRMLLPSQFARLHLNVWTTPEDRLTTRADVDACAGHVGALEPEPGRRYVVGVDLGLKRDATALAVCSRPQRGEGPVRVDRLDTWQGTSAEPVDLAAVEVHLLALARRYRARVIGDPWQAVALYQRVRRAGVKVEEFTFTSSSWTELAVGLYKLLRDRDLDLDAEDLALADELTNMRLIEKSPGVFRLDHDAGKHDDRVVAVALACHRLGAQPVASRARLRSVAGERIAPPRQFIAGYELPPPLRRR